MEKSTATELDSSSLSILMGKLGQVLIQMESIEMGSFPALKQAFSLLETEYNDAKHLIENHSSPVKQKEDLLQKLGRSLELVLLSSREATTVNKEMMEVLCKEIMAMKLDLSSSSSDWYENGTMDEIEEEEEEEEIEVEEVRIATIDDAILQIKSGNGENLKDALALLNEMMMDGMISDETIGEEGIISALCRLLIACKRGDRLVIIQMLRHLARKNDEHKEKMKQLEFLSALVKSLARDVHEQGEAVGLLRTLSNDAGLIRTIGRIRGCILLLIYIANSDKKEASHDAEMLLNSMSSNPQHVIHMAEAGYFKPMLRFLKEGSDMNKILMTTALSKLKLLDQHKAFLGENGVIESLIRIFSKENLEAKVSSLKALQMLLDLNENTTRLINTGIVSSILNLLFSVTSVMMTLREPAAAILAKVAKSESILVNQDMVHQMLSLLSLSSPVIQCYLMEALNIVASHTNATEIRIRMNDNGAIHLLLPFVNGGDLQLRTGALQLIHMLAKDVKGDLSKVIDYSHVHVLVKIVSSSNSEFDKVAALGILSTFPGNDKKISDILKKANLLPLLVSMINASHNSSTETMDQLTEGIGSMLIRFTNPADRKLQQYSSENGIFPVLLKLLSSNSEVTKSHAALCLAQLSQNTPKLSQSRILQWFCIPTPAHSRCQVHNAYCSTRSTLCIVKAGATQRLIQILDGNQRGADESILSCFSTLVQDEIWESGCKYLVDNSIVPQIVKILSCGSLKAKEKALWILERIFRVRAHREAYAETAQTLLIDLVQNDNPLLAPMVAKLLAELEILLSQSSYF